MQLFWIIVGVAVAVAVLCVLIFCFLTKPGRPRPQMQAFLQVSFAHRGLHDESHAENSLSAFALAVEHGYGIELDVRLSSDGVPVVFHDATLQRMTGEEGKVKDRTFAQLKQVNLAGTGEGIPALAEVLALVDGRVPLLVELKEEPFEYGVTEAAVALLKNYHGNYLIESFNPLALGRVKQELPEICRGVLATRFTKEKKYRRFQYFLAQNLCWNFVCRPDFIAYDHTCADSAAFRLARRVWHVPALAWTVRSEEEEKAARRNGFDAVIFERYLAPNGVTRREER